MVELRSLRLSANPKTLKKVPSEIKGMFLIRARRSLGLTAHRGWARLLIDRVDTQVQRPEFPPGA